MGRPRKRQREEEDHTRASSAGLSFGDIGFGWMASPLLDPDLAAFSSNGMGSLDFHPVSSGVGTQDMEQNGNNGDFYGGHSIDATFHTLDAPDFLPTVGFPTGHPSQDPHTFSPMYPANTAPLQPSFGLDEGATSSPSSNTMQGGCVCLGNLYSTLATFQSLPAPSFPYSMGALRKATRCGYEVVRCQKCPQGYNTAIQNSMLLVALLQMLINEYTKLLKHIDERAIKGESIAFRVGEVSSCFDQRHTGTPDCPMAINVDLNGEEWRMLARKGVRQEVLGSAEGNECLLNIIQEMRDRQVVWHESPCQGGHPPQDRTHTGSVNQPGGEKENSVCVQLTYIDHLKRMLEALEL